MKRHKFLVIIILFAFILPFGCAKKLSESITADTVPPEVDKTTILVVMFEKKDPMVYDPYYINVAKRDSLRKASIFTYPKDPADSLNTKNRPIKIEHPLIVETNKHLDSYNNRLKSTWKKYRYQYLIVNESETTPSAKYADVDKYRYVLIAKPVLLCYTNPDDNTILSYRYKFYFYDRKMKKELPEIDVFSSDPLKTNAAIIYKLNHLYSI
jgi:hypothetical protein